MKRLSINGVSFHLFTKTPSRFRSFSLDSDWHPVVNMRPILYSIIMAKLVLDLHDFYNKGNLIDAELNRVIDEAVQKRIKLVEIIPGKGSGQLKKRVLRFLAEPQIKMQYHRLEKDDKNFGRIFVHFRH